CPRTSTGGTPAARSRPKRATCSTAIARLTSCGPGAGTATTGPGARRAGTTSYGARRPPSVNRPSPAVSCPEKLSRGSTGGRTAY
ncbi:MAG: hypothetical protein AVDCRST_MAG22-3063, partial [uncultured Rubrobacteraceae bacterium]